MCRPGNRSLKHAVSGQEGDLANSFCRYLFALTAVHITKRIFMIWAASLTGAWGIFSFLTGLGIYIQKKPLLTFLFVRWVSKVDYGLFEAGKQTGVDSQWAFSGSVYTSPLSCLFLLPSEQPDVPWGQSLACPMSCGEYHSFQGPEKIFIIEIHVVDTQ